MTETVTPEQYKALAKAKPVRRKRKRQGEGMIVNACIRWCWAHGVRARRQNTGAYRTPEGQLIRYGKKGAGDIILCLPPHGRYTEIECKLPGEVQTPDQVAHQKEVEEDGGLYILAHSVEDLERLLKPLLARGP